MARDYKATLRLPRTDFPMKANLAKKEPEILAFWEREQIYQKMLEAARARGGMRFLLHDGPPYANGDIHHGHILNKVLKDIVVKFKNMTGQECEFIPGWDCHGLPIEHAVEKEIGRQAARSDPKALRKRCREFASHWVEVQKEQFRRLGVLADWANPYLTMTKEYEALIVREFGRFVSAGAVYIGKKPVLWCHVCETALAEAEVEYQETLSPSVWVKFGFASGIEERVPALKGRTGAIVIWTTTPWTLPANLAIALHPQETYVAVDVAGECMVVAEKRLQAFAQAIGIEPDAVLARFPGVALEGAKCHHPFLPRDSLVIVGEHVTMETGTGCVHTAPGHGEEDYEVGKRYGLEPYAPVDAQGRFTAEVPLFEGREVFDCDKDIVKLLDERGALLHAEDYSHAYPHCWRSKNPVIFRATAQWFISVDKTGLREAALNAIENVQFIPSWGKARISGMLKSRPDWCISRQRYWGVPIVGVVCTSCGETTTSPDLVERAARIVEDLGVEGWFDADLAHSLPEGYACPKCRGRTFEKVKDIIDVWFESGTSYAAVMEPRYGYLTKTDLYLEGSDQHRGWFQSSLLESVGTRGQAPYRAVLTHGFVVDGFGRKLSKSAGNYVDPHELIEQNGAELLRLWTAAEDYRDDIRMSEEILARLVEAYRKIRNTFRFMLGVLDDFDPATAPLSDNDLLDQDRWALMRCADLVQAVRQAYEAYEFHTVLRLVLDFCIRDLSTFYLDICKDRLYCAEPNGLERRSAQTAIYKILRALLTMAAPILSFTCEEAWAHLPKKSDDPSSVFLAPFPEPTDFGARDERLMALMRAVLEVRDQVLSEIERLRVAKQIGHSLEAMVTITSPPSGPLTEALRHFEKWLPELFIVSKVVLRTGTFSVMVAHAPGKKCARCWNWSEEVGLLAPEYDDLCPRCTDVMKRRA